MNHTEPIKRSDGAIGCGVMLAIVLAVVAHFIQANVLHFVVAGGLIGMVLGCFVSDDSSEGSHKRKAKRGDYDSYGSSEGRPRVGKVLNSSASSTSSCVVKRSRDFSRLEVPGGYVPFEMTRKETETKDYRKTETTIKTYINSKDLPTVLSSNHIEELPAGGP